MTTKARYTLAYSAEEYGKPLTYHLVKDYDLRVNILRAEVTPGERGHLLVDLEGDEANIARALEYLRQERIRVIPLNRQVRVNKDRCVHCGACTAVCFSNAMVMEREQWEVQFNPDRCIVCGLCIDACPVRVISIGFGEDMDEQ